MREEHEDSTKRQLLRLAVGETCTRSMRLSLEGDFNLATTVIGTTNALRNSLDSSINRVKDIKPDRAFRVETGRFFTRDLNLIVCAVATRTS